MSPAPERSAREAEWGRSPSGPGPASSFRASPADGEGGAGPAGEPRRTRGPALPEERPSPPPTGVDLRCRRCEKPIRDLEMELYFLQTGLCFWCAYVDSQG